MSPKEPCRGNLNPKITIAVMSKTDPVARNTAAIIFPATISIGEAGVTSSCSNVPISRSREIESAETIMPTVVVMRHISPGMNEFRAIKFGLNHLLTTGPDVIGSPFAF